MTNSFSLMSVLATAAEEIVFDKKTVLFWSGPEVPVDNESLLCYK